ncbi:hypothetical protein [Sphaerisporangium rhizosphaerae]|uniref:Uncharacterized protein n=1 Tax=Sphaerisporangium rhizosphaerae TaxID=2269375 RepID=A0ABW2PD75_9ACTN
MPSDPAATAAAARSAMVWTARVPRGRTIGAPSGQGRAGGGLGPPRPRHLDVAPHGSTVLRGRNSGLPAIANLSDDHYVIRFC